MRISIFEVVVDDCEFSSIGVRSVWCRRDGPTPKREIRRVCEIHLMEDTSSTTGSPRFADQGTIVERGFFSETIKDFLNDLDGHVNRVSITLWGRGDSGTDWDR